MTRILRLLLPAAALWLAACDVTVTQAPTGSGGTTASTPSVLTNVRARQAAQRFVAVVETVEPVAEQECRRRARGLNCDFLIVVDDRPGQQPNAFQTLDRNGRPVIAFNLPLIASVENADELAFIMGHEAAHHIADHIARQRQSATAGALIFGGLASITGGDAGAVEAAQRVGASVGARTYSKDYELEADQLGTIIAARAGYNPIRGSEFFQRIPDPGDRFLGTHPPNAQRAEIVRRTAAGL